MPVAQERRSCENVSLERRAFCTSTFLCVSGEWRRIEDPFIRTSRHDCFAFAFPTRGISMALPMCPCERRSLRSWKDRYLLVLLHVSRIWNVVTRVTRDSRDIFCWPFSRRIIKRRMFPDKMSVTWKRFLFRPINNLLTFDRRIEKKTVIHLSVYLCTSL